MKESKLNKILTTPTIDEAMDQNMTDFLLNIDSHAAETDSLKGYIRGRQLYNNKRFGYRFPKVAVIILSLVLIGAGTALAANYYVKSYPHRTKVMTEEELYTEYGIEIDKSSLYREDVIRKRFGEGNRSISLPRDAEGNALEINEEGNVVFEDGTVFTPRYIPDPNRYENAKKAGNEAFAEVGYPDLTPTYLYDNYILGESGIICFESNQDGTTHKWLMAEFMKDGYETGDFSSEIIWVNFSASKTSLEGINGILVDSNIKEEDLIYSSYTNSEGILCTIEENNVTGNIAVYVTFDSDTIGNGRLMIEFIGFDIPKIQEIMDTLPLSEADVEIQDSQK